IDLGDTDSVNILLSSEQIQALTSKGAYLIVRNDNVEMQIPLSNLKADKNITFGIHLSDDEDDAVSNIYDLTIQIGDEEVNEFETPVQLAFRVDMDKVDDKDNLDVYYFDEGKDEWVAIPGGELDDGTFSVDVDHFTKFTVMEKK